MNIRLVYLLLVLVFTSCMNDHGILIPISNTIRITETDSPDSIIIKAAHIVPTDQQYEALKNEFIAFIHFGPNTFTRKEWGNGTEDPSIFDLQNLDTDQWCQAMKEAQMKMVILTVKHHDGFVLWQSRYTQHGVMSSPYQEGKGDILKELSASCAKYGLKLGVYLSPADLYQIENTKGLYGNLSEYSDRSIPRPIEGRPFKNKTTFTFHVDDYNEYFLNQLFELLTEYGPIHEVWFDGAHPKRKGGQEYNYLAWKELISSLAPQAVIFGKQDIRWCGNESGRTRDTEWNTIPYQNNPHEMNVYADLMAKDLGSRAQLYGAKYLHYQQAETNTSIREGWFYRDEHIQKVRSAEDVFDIYERSVGANSTFLLNIPPNREGKFSEEDVKVLKEVGQRITTTYHHNLFAGAHGPAPVLDADEETYELLDEEQKEIIISTDTPVLINRLVIQEAIMSHGERVEKHGLDIWENNAWKEVATASNIGYKRILRFPEVSSDRFRIRVTASRLNPAISNITAHYDQEHPPQLNILRIRDGLVDIQIRKHDFGWKVDGDPHSNFDSSALEIRYTTDGSIPDLRSEIFSAPFSFPSGELKAIAFLKDQKGSLASKTIGIAKDHWKLINSDSEIETHTAMMAFDENPSSYWQSESKKGSHFMAIDLGASYSITGFSYTPQKANGQGMIEQGELKISDDKKTWRTVESFEFGNLINDPSTRTHYFKAPIKTQYIMISINAIAGGGNSASIAEIDFFTEP